MSDPIVRILPDHLANQIAAGEVVQRPSSVVKELVENAIDAGATSISVIVRQAGKQLIHVIDDGAGMVRQDLELATVRHATSKISSESDLHAIRTLGFRGEALASIAAVADIEIRTRRQGSDTGHVLMSRPGTVFDIKPAACDQGSQVLVRNLFFNVPARRKFLKTDLTEFRHISEVMQQSALSRPDLRFTFHDGDNLVFDVRPDDLKRRIMDILAIDASRYLVPVEGGTDPIVVSGFVGLPEISRQSRSGQFLFMNNRPISSRALSHAISSSYEHLLDTGQHPVYVLHIVIDPQTVDVNVHPQKHEVKFEDERLVYLMIQEAVTKALASADVIPSFLSDVPLSSSPLRSLPSRSGEPPTIVNRLTGEIHTPSKPSDIPSGGYVRRAPSGPSSSERASITALFGVDEKEVTDVLQAGQQYIITTSAEGVMIVDQRAAHERVLFERAMKKESDDGKTGQALLFAVMIPLPPSRIALLREYQDEFAALGFRLEIHDGGKVEIHAVPTDVQPGTEDATMEGMLGSLEDAGRLPRERRHEGVAAAFASRQAMRYGERLSNSEMKALVKDLFSCSVPHVTPQGKPTYIVITFDEFVQRFR